MKKRILLVDDDKRVHEIFKLNFKFFDSAFNEHLILDSAFTLQKAKTLLLKHEYDIVLSDYMLDQNNTADDLIKFIKTNNINVTYNLITSIRDVSKIREVLSMGVKRVIYKPFTWHDVLKSIYDIISLKEEVLQ